MRTVFVCILVVFVNYNIQAQQNLVPNPSFEEFAPYPCNTNLNYSTLNFAAPWSSSLRVQDSLVTVDHWFGNDTCLLRVPSNVGFGWQYPKTGSAYIGFGQQLTYIGAPYFFFESFYVPLDSTLSPENNYELCLYLSLPERMCLNIKKLSFSITPDTLTQGGLNNLSSNDIQYLEGLEQCNYLDWTQICTTFSPSQAGNILTFNVITNPQAAIADTVLYNHDECEHNIEVIGTYFYMDDVSLVNKGKNTGFKPSIHKIDFAFYPNPSTGLINLSFGKPVNGQITVSNVMGQMLLTESVHGESSTLDLSSFSAGIYFLQFTDTNGSVSTQKILLE